MNTPSLSNGFWTITTGSYSWSWKELADEWTLSDSQGRRMARGPLRPEFVFADGTRDPFLDGGHTEVVAKAGQLTIAWTGRGGHVRQQWHFHPEFFAVEPLQAASSRAAAWARVEQFCGLASHYALLPGLSMSSLVPPVVDLHSRLRITTTLGAGAMRGPGLAQQWGLPSHWFALCDTSERWNAANARSLDSDAVCIGLSDLPEGDFWVRTEDRAVTMVLNVRSDLWHWYADGVTTTVGLALEFFVRGDFEQAARSWYRHRAEQGGLAGSAYAATERDVRTWTLLNTWGSQVAERIQPEELNQTRLDRYFDGLQASGLRVNHFVIDDKWEGAYGILSHDEERFPAFEEFLKKVRSHGYRVGLWAAFLRCEDPTKVGLTEEHLMKDAQGKVLRFQHQTASYGIYDVTHPQVAQTLGALARRCVERYQPDLIKCDFGYELPTLDNSRPFDARFRGERLLLRGLEVILGAMKSVKPNLVVMYYGLSPLLAPWYDLHSTDDMVYCPGDYDVEGNRRLSLASFLGEVGMPVSSSTGYDWATAPDLWFDAVAMGVPGTLLPFGTDERGEGPTAPALAFFNGLGALARAAPQFSIEWIDGHPRPGYRVLTTGSWRRLEHGQTVLLALRGNHVLPGLQTEGTQVLSSLDGLPLGQSRHFGVVPLATGSFVMTVPSAGLWQVTKHRLQAAPEVTTLQADHQLSFTFDAASEGAPIEWIEFETKSVSTT